MSDMISKTVSQESYVGFVSGSPREGIFDVHFTDDSKSEVEAAWIISAVIPGDLVRAAVNGLGQRLVVAKYVGMTDNPKSALIRLPGKHDSQEISAELIRANTDHITEKAYGELFPQNG